MPLKRKRRSLFTTARRQWRCDGDCGDVVYPTERYYKHRLSNRATRRYCSACALKLFAAEEQSAASGKDIKPFSTNGGS